MKHRSTHSNTTTLSANFILCSKIQFVYFCFQEAFLFKLLCLIFLKGPDWSVSLRRLRLVCLSVICLKGPVWSESLRRLRFVCLSELLIFRIVSHQQLLVQL